MTTTVARFPRTGRPRSIDSQARSVRTRSTLLAAAADLITTGRTVTINDVTAESGITRGGLYFHFDSKIDLIRAVIDDAADQVHAAYATGDGVVADRSAMTIIEDFIDRIASNPTLHAVCVLWTDSEFAGTARSATRNPLRGVLIDALTGAATPSRDPAVTADLLLAVITAHTATAGEGVGTDHVRTALLTLAAEILR